MRQPQAVKGKSGRDSFGLTGGRANRILGGMSELRWWVAHTKPRCEKKLVEHCRRQGISTTLPCYESAHKYRGKTVVFQKPLFPGYVFLELAPGQRDGVRQNDHVANLLEVIDKETIKAKLQDILLALETQVGVRLTPENGTGM